MYCTAEEMWLSASLLIIRSNVAMLG